MIGAVAKLIYTRIEKFVVCAVERRKGYQIHAHLYGTSGDDSPPLAGDKMLEVRKAGKGKSAIVGALNISQGAKEGERVLYSRNADGEVQAKIYLKEDGEIVFQDGSNFAVRFNELEKGFNQLKNDFNSHVHPFVGLVAGVSGTTSRVAKQSAASIAHAKVEKVRMP